jgi:precorrin-2 dehydrogenase/sirohydrochlorin ferrochelatase
MTKLVKFWKNTGRKCRQPMPRLDQGKTGACRDRCPTRRGSPAEPPTEPMNEPMNEQADQASDHAPPDGYPDYPVVLSVSGRRCLVVGGGPVAAGKVGGLLRSGAQVTVVAPEVGRSIRTLAVRPQAPGTTGSEPVPGRAGGRWPALAIEARPYRAGEAGGYDLVITATGVPDVDRLVVADALAAGVLVNSADGSSPGTVRLPSVLRSGPVTVAVSTGGSSPALARWLRDRIASSLGTDLATLAALLEEARHALQRAGRSTGSVDWATVLDHQIVPLVEAGRLQEARAVLLGLCGSPGRTDGTGGARPAGPDG